MKLLNLEIIKLLLEVDGINLNVINYPFINHEKTALYIAIESNKIDIVKLLLENKLIQIR